MAEFSKLIITEQGKNLVMKAIENEIAIRFTKIVTSSHMYSLDELKTIVSLEDVRQENVISEIDKENTNTIKIKAILPNTGLEEGYFLKAVGICASDPDEGEILYGISIETSEGGCYVPAYNNQTVSNIYFNLSVAVGNSENVLLEVDQSAVVTAGQLNEILYPDYAKAAELSQLENGDSIFSMLGKIGKSIVELINHIGNMNNPHGVTKSQVGLSNVDNTADANKSVKIAATATTATKLGSKTVGSGTKPIYLNAGTATAFNATVGSGTTPVYMNAGVISACTLGILQIHFGEVAHTLNPNVDFTTSFSAPAGKTLVGGLITGYTPSASWETLLLVKSCIYQNGSVSFRTVGTVAQTYTIRYIIFYR